MKARAFLLASVLALPLAAGEICLRPPLWVDRDDKPVPMPREQQVSELHAILYNTWLRHLSPEHRAAAAGDEGALNVNAWDEVPDSSWFTNRIGRRVVSFEEIVDGLGGKPPEPPPWRVLRIEDEGYTPKLRIRDSAGRIYVLKFDPGGPERNSGAERISTLVAHASGYNVPNNTVAFFRAIDLQLAPDATYSDALGKRRKMTPADLFAGLKRVKPLADGRYRGLASQFLPGRGIGKFSYAGTRKDDPNDLIPHELRRELRGLRVIASWINHADAGDKNTFDTYLGESGRGYVKHYLIDFGSTMGSGDYVNGPFRIGHEYVFDGAAMGRSFVTLGIWRRPWDVEGRILYPEVGYYQAALFQPAAWKPNYPNLAFVRMDDADAYWGAKIVTAFSDELIAHLAEAGLYSRAVVTRHIRETLQQRRDAIGSYWFDRVSPLEEFRLTGGVLEFRDLGLERGHAGELPRRYRVRVEGNGGWREFAHQAVELPSPRPVTARPDRWGRTPVARVWVQSSRRNGSGWALPVEVVLGRNAGSAALVVLGWRHAAKTAPSKVSPFPGRRNRLPHGTSIPPLLGRRPPGTP